MKNARTRILVLLKAHRRAIECQKQRVISHVFSGASLTAGYNCFLYTEQNCYVRYKNAVVHYGPGIVLFGLSCEHIKCLS